MIKNEINISTLSGFSTSNGQSKPTYTYIDGRPFVVEGNVRSAISLTCGLDNCDNSKSWTSGSTPSMLENSTVANTIGLEWLQQAEAEHASIASFARHTLQLMSIGASSELILRSQRASIDEIEHAKMCYGFASKFMEVEIYPGPLDMIGSLDKLNIEDIIESVIQDGCIQETISAIEGHFRAKYTSDEVVKNSLTKLAADETKHAQLAWDTIKWIVEKYPQHEVFVSKVFEKELKKEEKRSITKVKNHTEDICDQSIIENMLMRYGIPSKSKKDRVRDAAIGDIIKPVYEAGFEDFSSISHRITTFYYHEI